MDSNLVVRAPARLLMKRAYRLSRAGRGRAEGLPAGAIAQQIGLSPSSLSFHLKDLSHADLVTARQDGRFIYYAANFESMGGLIGFLTENCCAGAACGVPTAPDCCGGDA